MNIKRIIRTIAKEEQKPEWYIRDEMQKAMDSADWSKISPDGKRPASFETAFRLIVKEVKSNI